MCRCLTKQQIWLILHISGAWFDDDTRTVSRKRSKITKYFVQIWHWIFLYMRLCFVNTFFFFSKVVFLRVFHLKQQFNEINLFQTHNKFTFVIIALLEIRAEMALGVGLSAPHSSSEQKGRAPGGLGGLLNLMAVGSRAQSPPAPEPDRWSEQCSPRCSRSSCRQAERPFTQDQRVKTQ